MSARIAWRSRTIDICHPSQMQTIVTATSSVRIENRSQRRLGFASINSYWPVELLEVTFKL